MDWKWNILVAFIYTLLVLNGVNASIRIIEGSEKIFPANKKFTLTCLGSGTLRWKTPVGNSDLVRELPQQNSSILTVENPSVFDSGYYQCYGERILNSEVEIYVYVFDHENLFIPVSSNIIRVRVGKNATIPCLATHPNINVTLSQNNQPVEGVQYNPRQGFLLKNVTVADHGYLSCEGKYGDLEGSTYFLLYVKVQ